MKAMRLIRNVHLGVKSLLLHKLRSLLTVLGVVFGVGSVIAMLSVGEGAEEAALDQIRRLGSTNIMVWSSKPLAEESLSTGRSFLSVYGLKYDDENRVREGLATVRCTVPMRQIRKEAWLGSNRMELRVVGTTADWFRLVDRTLVAGRFLTEQDMLHSAPVCVLTEHTARRLMAGENTIGQAIRIGSDYFRVVGIVQTESGAAAAIQTPDMAIDAYIPLNVHRRRFGEMTRQISSGSFQSEKVELHGLIVQVNDEDEVMGASEAIRAMLERFHPKGDFRMDVPLTLLRQTQQTKERWTWTLFAIALISLLVGGIGIMNIMLATVTERTREIGIRRAIGARRRQIVGQFLIETVVLTSIGGILGAAAGPAFAWLITRLADMPTVVPLYSIVLSLVISAAVGIIFGLYPAYRAATVDPIVALRHE